ncbi:transport energizing protein, ExbD/TolR family, partial [Bordetella holmesii H620]
MAFGSFDNKGSGGPTGS